MTLHRWYRRANPDGGWSYRMPVMLLDYADSGRPKVKYRFPAGQFTACSGAAWLRWAKGAEVMPEGFEPEGVKP